MAFGQLCRRLLFKRINPVMYATASMIVNCAVSNEPNSQKIQWEPPDITKFTFEYMIKHSTIDAVNSVSQALTVVYTAIESTSNDYRHSLSRLISLTNETLMYEVSDLHRDLIIAVRAEVQSKKELVTQLVSYMDYVQKMAVATTEASYMAGMDSLSTTLCQRMDDALNHMNLEVIRNQQLEKEYTILQQKCIEKTNKEVTSKEKDDNENIVVETTLD